jgi:uncharacterized protein (TIRG00374 family)
MVKRETLFSLTRVILAVAILALLSHYDIVAFEDLLLLKDAPGALAEAAVMILLTYPLAALRWKVLLDALAVQLRFVVVFRILSIGVFFNTFLPGGTSGDLVKAGYLWGNAPGQRAEAMVALLADRIVATIGLAIVALIFLGLRWDVVVIQPALLTMAVIMAGAVAGGLGLWAIGMLGVGRWGDRLSGWREGRGRLRALTWRVIKAVETYQGRPGALLVAVAAAVLAHLLSVGALAVIGITLDGISLGFVDFALAGPVSFLTNLIPLTPGGLGLGEAAFAQICRLMAAAEPAVAYGTIFFAFRSLSACVVLPVGFLSFLAHGKVVPPDAGNPRN